MVTCINCAWANYDKVTGTRVRIFKPDMFAQINLGESLPEVPVVESCGQGQSYYTQWGDHTCPKWEDLEEVLASELIAAEAGGFHLVTNRVKLPTTNNMLVLIDAMTEDCESLSDVFMDAFMLGPDKVTSLIYNLNDMNIRGEQVFAALEYADNDITTLVQLAESRDTVMVQHVNATVINEEYGPAVVQYAATLAHKDQNNDGATAS